MLRSQKIINRVNFRIKKLEEARILTHVRALLRSTLLSSAKKFLAKNIVPKTPNFFTCGVSKFLAFYGFYFFLPFIVFAQIEITEIMYNPGEDASGSKADGGREWIEIYNSGLSVENLDGWKLVGGDNKGHPFSVIQGSFTIKPQEYLIIADIDIVKDSSTFLTDYPNFSGTVLNSNFVSLINSSEEKEILTIKNSNLESMVQVSYLPIEEANDTGNSLQKNSGNWVPALPTPGVSNCSVDEPTNPQDDPADESQDEIQPQVTTPPSVRVFKIEPQVFASITTPLDKPIAGAGFFFEADAWGLEDKPLVNEEYQWTFGDGGSTKGQKVLYTYQHPGDYVIVLQVISGEYTGTDRFQVEVLPSEIIISKLDVENQFIEIHNPSVHELNLSWWRLRVDGNYFALPKNTIVLPKKYLKFSSIITGLILKQNSQVDLLYPNGAVAFSYVPQPKVVISIPQEKPKVIVPVNQVASIRKAVEPMVVMVQPEDKQEYEDELESIVLEATTTLPLQESPMESRNNIFNKWNLSLVGIVSMASVGLIFANKQDI